MGYYNTKTPHTILRNMFENPGWLVNPQKNQSFSKFLITIVTFLPLKYLESLVGDY
jgi:hypothetical protein